MATRISPATVQRLHHHHHSPRLPQFHNFLGYSPPVFCSLAYFRSRIPLATYCYLQSPLSVDSNFRPSFPYCPSNSRKWSGSCRATSPGSPPPPKLDAPPGENSDSSSGSMSSFSKVKDAVRIFFAVFFWMSLFFWSCIWDGRNDGRPNKGSRFRR